MNTHTSTAFSNPFIGASNTSDNLAATTPEPLTILPAASNFAPGNTNVTKATIIVSKMMIVNADILSLFFFVLAIFLPPFWLFVIIVPVSFRRASLAHSSDVIIPFPSLLYSQNSTQDSTLGSILPLANSPALIYFFASLISRLRKLTWSIVLYFNETVSTVVNIRRASAFNFLASKLLERSLSITASTPTKVSPSRTTGIPPPPDAITILPWFNRSLIKSSSTISIGLGEGTTLL